MSDQQISYHCLKIVKRNNKKKEKFFGGEDGLTQVGTSIGAHICYFEGGHMEETPEDLTGAISEVLGRV